MRIPTGGPHKRLRSIIRLKTSTYTLERGDGNLGALGETRESTTNVTADLWLFAANEVPLDTDFGERLTGQLRGLALVTEDVQEGDTLTYSGVKYRVSEVLESESDVYLMIGLERVVND